MHVRLINATKWNSIAEHTSSTRSLFFFHPKLFFFFFFALFAFIFGIASYLVSISFACNLIALIRFAHVARISNIFEREKNKNRGKKTIYETKRSNAQLVTVDDIVPNNENGKMYACKSTVVFLRAFFVVLHKIISLFFCAHVAFVVSSF